MREGFLFWFEEVHETCRIVLDVFREDFLFLVNNKRLYSSVHQSILPME